MTDKDFFKILKHECAEYSDNITESFPYWVTKIYFRNMTDDEIENAIAELDHNDESIDGFFVSHPSKEIIFIQCKSIISEKQRSPCKKEWLSYFFDVTNKLENDDYIDSHKNQRLKDIAAEYITNQKKNYSVKFYFFHLGYLPNNNREIIKSYNINGKHFYYFGFDEIKDQYFEYKSMLDITEPESFDIELTYSKTPEIVNEKIGYHNTLISIITGDQIIKLRQQHKYKLFDKNVRFSLGMNKINNGIVESALSNKSDFYFYNNGITITCSSFKFREHNNTIRVEYPQIINGAQTVDSIYQAYKTRKNKLDRSENDLTDISKKVTDEFKELNVLFRLIRTDKPDSEFGINVIKYNNSQNAIQIRDFFSNNPEQLALQKYFSKYGYFYEVKRGERNYIKKNVHIHLNKKLSNFKYPDRKIDIEKLASLYRAFLGEPSAKEVGAKYILNDDEVYQELFGSTISDISDQRVKEMIFASNIMSLIEVESKLYKKILHLLIAFETDTKIFTTLKDSAQTSSIFKAVLKSKFDTIEIYRQRRPELDKKIREYYPFSQGKYQVLGIFKLILDKCDYFDQLVESDLIHDIKFIENKMIKQWLPTCLDKLLVPLYKKAINEESLSMGAFYLRSKTFQNILNLFDSLDIDEDKEYEELFPLKY